MILDTSALLAMLFKEPGHEELIRKISEADYLGIGTPHACGDGDRFECETGQWRENDSRPFGSGTRAGPNPFR